MASVALADFDVLRRHDGTAGASLPVRCGPHELVADSAAM